MCDVVRAGPAGVHRRDRRRRRGRRPGGARSRAPRPPAVGAHGADVAADFGLGKHDSDPHVSPFAAASMTPAAPALFHARSRREAPQASRSRAAAPTSPASPPSSAGTHAQRAQEVQAGIVRQRLAHRVEQQRAGLRDAAADDDEVEIAHRRRPTRSSPRPQSRRGGTPAARRGRPRRRRRRVPWRRRPAGACQPCSRAHRAIPGPAATVSDAAVPAARAQRARPGRRPRGRRDRRCRCARRRARRRAPVRRRRRSTPPSRAGTRAPRPAPRQRSPIAMHSPSPPSRTGTPVTAATRSTIGNRCHAVMLMGLTVPAGRSIGPAEAMPTPRTPPPPPRAPGDQFVHHRPRSPRRRRRGVGSCAWCTERPVVVDEARRRSWCRRCRGPACDRPSVAVGVVGLAGIAGVLVARCEPNQLGAPRVEPQPERPAPRGAPAGAPRSTAGPRAAAGPRPARCATRVRADGVAKRIGLRAW